MSGVLILSISTVIVKIIGLAYKIPLISILGAEGMGYFNTAYEIFALLCGVSTSGLPVAVSMLVSSAREVGNTKRAVGIYKTSSALLLTKGVLFSGGMAIFAEPIARAVGNPQAYFAILAISPALLFTCVSGAARGYFQGCRIMTPTALSQLCEALGKLILGVLFAALGVRAGFGLAASAALAVLGVSIGSLISALYLFVKKHSALKGQSVSIKGRGYVLALLRISLPITMCSALIGTTRVIDMTLMLRRLTDIGVSASGANKIYGAYTTLALPVYGLVPALIPPITESLIPRLAAAVESGAEREQARAVKCAARLTAFVAMPASVGIAVYSREILSLLFSGQTESINVSAPLLSALGASVLLSCLISMTNAVLQSYRRVLLPLASLAAGAIVKAVSAYFLIGNPSVAEMGAPISTFLSNATVLIFNCIFVSLYIPRESGLLAQLPKPLLASLCASALSFAAYRGLVGADFGQNAAFLSAFVLTVVIYLFLAVVFGVVGKDDIDMFRKKKK